MRTRSWVVGGALTALAYGPAAGAQESLLPSTSWGAAPTFTAWHFGTPIKQSEGSLTDVMQFAVPLRWRTVIGERWNIDVSGAAATSSISLQDGGTTKTLSLNGLTDLKVRATGAVAGDRVLFTGGVNLPTGTTGLNGDQTSVLSVIGAPGLRMPVAGLGLGPGATAGLVAAKESGDWALAAGGSLEVRTEYTLVQLALANGTSLTKVTPGTALHATLGADRPMGEGHFGLLVVSDVFTQDQITTGAPGSTSTTKYKLGPQVTAVSRMDFAAPGWRESGANVALRYRSEFADATGKSVSGSSGMYLDGSLTGIRGGATGRGIVLGADARYQSGLTFTDALVGAAVSAVGATVGVEIPTTSSVMRIAARGQFGQFNTGTTSSTGMGLSVVFALAARREAR
jgi:hypothetical protein